MRQKSMPVREPAERVVKDIRRATRRHFLAEDKIRVVLDGLRGEVSTPEQMYGPPPVGKRFRFDGRKRSASMYPACSRSHRLLATMGIRTPWAS